MKSAQDQVKMEFKRRLFNLDEEADPDFSRCLMELSSLTADKLANEPDRLNDERSAVLEETESLAFQNYKTFIQAANSTKSIYEDFTIIDRKLSDLIDTVPSISQQCSNFLSDAQKIGNSRQANSLTLTKHSQILEILEIPQVIDTCLRGGYYEDALDLINYFNKLERRLSHIPIIAIVSAEVKNRKSQLVQLLVDQLHGNLSLPQCLKVVGLIKRLGVFSEAELRLKFLLSRDSWFEKQLKAVSLDDPYQHICRVIELSRVHLFDIVTQYRAVFSDDDSLVSGQPSMLRLDAVPVHLPGIFQTWILHRVKKFISVLEADLASGITERLDSVLAQCQYFGLSLGRVGGDFRTLLLPIFENAVWAHFAEMISRTTARVRHFIPAVASDKIRPDDISVPSGTSAEESHPLASVMAYPFLAVYVNSVLNFFNNFRLCLPVVLAPKISSSLQESLTMMCDDVKALQAEQKSPEETKRLEAFSQRLLTDVAPHFNRCLDELFPPQSLAPCLGLSLAEFSNRKVGYAKINISAIQPPLPEHKISSTLPPQEVVIFSETSAINDDHIDVHNNDEDVTKTNMSGVDNL